MWRTVKLGELFDVGSSRRVLKADWKAEGIPFYRGREITMLSKSGIVDNELFITEEHFQSLSSKSGVPDVDDIMITAIGTIGNTYIVQPNHKFYFKDASVLWLRKKTDVSSKYIQYWLKTDDFFSQLDAGNGATVDTLTIKKLASVEISLPPLANQQRIVAKLDAAFAEIDRAIEVADNNILNTESLYAYAIDSTFLSFHTKLETLGAHSDISYGYTAKASFESGKYKFLRITDIQENHVDWESVPYCEVEPKKLKRVLLHDGDIVFARTGATTGKSFLVENPKDAVFASYLIRVSVDRTKLKPSFVMHYFQSASYWKQVNEGISGAAQGGFNATKLGELKLPIINLREQQSVVEKLDAVQKQAVQLKNVYFEKKRRLSLLKSAILAQGLQPREAA